MRSDHTINLAHIPGYGVCINNPEHAQKAQGALSTLRAKQMTVQHRVRKEDISRLLSMLRKQVSRLQPLKVDSPWIEYEDCNTYDEQSWALKMSFVDRALATAEPKVVWDLGCNKGTYSILAAKHADWVLAMDSDASTVNALYNRVKGEWPNILPLVIDLLKIV